MKKSSRPVYKKVIPDIFFHHVVGISPEGDFMNNPVLQIAIGVRMYNYTGAAAKIIRPTVALGFKNYDGTDFKVPGVSSVTLDNIVIPNQGSYQGQVLLNISGWKAIAAAQKPDAKYLATLMYELSGGERTIYQNAIPLSDKINPFVERWKGKHFNRSTNFI